MLLSLVGDVEVEDDILDKFFEFQVKAEIYYVYHSIQRYMVRKMDFNVVGFLC